MKKNYKWSLVSLLIIVALAFSACAAPADTESADRIAELEAELAAAAEGDVSEAELAELEAALAAAQEAASMEDEPSWAPLTMEDFTSADIDWQGPAKNGPLKVLPSTSQYYLILISTPSDLTFPFSRN